MMFVIIDTIGIKSNSFKNAKLTKVSPRRFYPQSIGCLVPVGEDPPLLFLFKTLSIYSLVFFSIP